MLTRASAPVSVPEWCGRLMGGGGPSRCRTPTCAPAAGTKRRTASVTAMRFKLMNAKTMGNAPKCDGRHILRTGDVKSCQLRRRGRPRAPPESPGLSKYVIFSSRDACQAAQVELKKEESRLLQISGGAQVVPILSSVCVAR